MRRADLMDVLRRLKFDVGSLFGLARPPGARSVDHRADQHAPKVTAMLPTLNGYQLAIIATAADRLPPEKRDTFIDRVKARLQLHGRRPDDEVVAEAVRQALSGLIQNSAA
jgi:hypothetical protein